MLNKVIDKHLVTTSFEKLEASFVKKNNMYTTSFYYQFQKTRNKYTSRRCKLLGAQEIQSALAELKLLYQRNIRHLLN